MTKTVILLFMLSTGVGGVTQGEEPKVVTAFEVASVKPATKSLVGGKPLGIGRRGGPGTSDPSQITWPGVSLKRLLMTAYELKDYQIDGPEWLDTIGIDVLVKVPKGANKQQVVIMWQNLLKDRLGLKAHPEIKVLPVYELVLGRGRLKIKESAPKADQASSESAETHSGMPVPGPNGCPVFPDGAGMTSVSRNAGVSRLCASGATLEIVFAMLAKSLDRPVLNKSGLEGKYDFMLEFGSDQAHDIIGAFEQLGLKLEPRKSPVKVLVIDSIDKAPTPN